MKRLIECVPNFSEGRDAAKVDAIVSAMSAVPGVYVLDKEMDADHNRCVVTLAGEPDPVAEAALRGVGKALELIDLNEHSGAHPRVGAADVIPFIPISGVTIDDCVALARRVGKEIWTRYRIPVFFYEAAATRPDRVNLENVRKGQFEGLRDELKRNHDRQPDIGEPKLHPTAGVTVVGARKFLIAYNVNLNTSDVGVANKIAKAIRVAWGGLRYVKSLRVDLKARNLAQVSINLTDFEQTPMHRVYEMVKREAARYGAVPVGSEIVGLIPKKAIEMAADYFLQVENFSPEQIFENKLEGALTAAIDRDSSAYDGVLAAYKMPQGDGEEIKARDAAIQAAMRGATEVPLEVATSTVALFERIGQLATIAAASMKSDLDVARLKAAAGAKAALANVEINLDGIKDAGYVTAVREKVSALRERLGETSRVNA